MKLNEKTEGDYEWLRLSASQGVGGGGGYMYLLPPAKFSFCFPCSLEVFLRFWCSPFSKICLCSRVPSLISWVTNYSLILARNFSANL